MKPYSHDPIGKLVDIGSHRLHIHSTGEGSPAVVLEAGGLSWYLDWHLVKRKPKNSAAFAYTTEPVLAGVILTIDGKDSIHFHQL